MRLPVRLAKLEADTHERRVIVMWQQYWESEQEAKARWLRDHPGEDLEGAGIRAFIIRWGVPEPEPEIGVADSEDGDRWPLGIR